MAGVRLSKELVHDLRVYVSDRGEDDWAKEMETFVGLQVVVPFFSLFVKHLRFLYGDVSLLVYRWWPLLQSLC